MQLYLVQHGAAKSEAEDPQRGLSEEGRRRVEQIRDFLVPLKLPLDCIEHSEKLRARQTAEILAGGLNPREGIHQVAGMAPNDDIEPMHARLESETKNIILVGHLPYLSRLVARLLGLPADRAVVQFQMGGVVRLDNDRTAGWVVRWMLVPELLVVPPRGLPEATQ